MQDVQMISYNYPVTQTFIVNYLYLFKWFYLQGVVDIANENQATERSTDCDQRRKQGIYGRLS